MNAPVLYQAPAPALKLGEMRSAEPTALRWLADALFTSDLSARSEHTRMEVATAIRHAIGTYRGTGGCAAEVAAAYGEHPETAARRMRWARTVIDGIDTAAGWPGASS